MASTSDQWLHNFQHNNNNNNTPSLGQVAPPYAATSPPDLFFSGLVSESTVVSTPIPPGPAQLGPEGRVNKPVRRRTRASRRTPTTLLNTDTTNFRAMVQQFTGGPSNSFPNISSQFGVETGTGPGLGYGLPYPMGQLQYATTNTTTLSSSSTNTTNNNNSFSTNNVIMQRNMFDNNNNNNAYVTNARSNSNVNGGSSSSENRSTNSNNFPY